MTPTEDREIVELAEFIALRHEERPTTEDTFEAFEDAGHKPYDGFWISVGEWWIWNEDWSPRLYTEPEIAMRLLKELLVDWIVSIDWSSQLKNYEVTLDSKSSNDSHVGVGGSLELAIARAWKKAVELK